jgi:hypothetical protein
MWAARTFRARGTPTCPFKSYRSGSSATTERTPRDRRKSSCAQRASRALSHGWCVSPHLSATGFVTGVFVLGAFGFLTTAVEMSGALMMLVIYGTVVVAVLDAWLWPSHPVRVFATALMVPFVVAAAWFLPGAYGWQELADVVALAAAAGATAFGSRSTLFDPARLFAPLP